MVKAEPVKVHIVWPETVGGQQVDVEASDRNHALTLKSGYRLYANGVVDFDALRRAGVMK